MEVKDLTKKKCQDLHIGLDQGLSSVKEQIILEMCHSFLNGVPFPYLLENSEFYHQDFYINNSVLIPRPETEYLVDIIAKEFKNKVKRILDIGTGSGVIVLSLVSHGVGQTGVGVDISDEALEVAKINCQKLGLEKKVTLMKSDRLSRVEGSFDLMVSNPPYIKASSHKKLVHQNVDLYEPHRALYLPDDYYVLWFEDFFAEIRSHLKGTFFMEGHELEVENQAKMLSKLGFTSVEVLNDMSGTKRYLRANFGI